MRVMLRNAWNGVARCQFKRCEATAPFNIELVAVGIVAPRDRAGAAKGRNARMSLLSSVIGGLMGGSGNSSPMGGILMNLLGGGSQAGSQMGNQGGIGGMASQLFGGQSGGGQGGGGFGGGGGLGGLVSQFQQGGLGHVMQSWIGTGANEPVSPQQLQGVFGQDQVQSMASQAGMQPQDFLSQLSQHLPDAVNGMTPDGRLPDEGTRSV